MNEEYSTGTNGNEATNAASAGGGSDPPQVRFEIEEQVLRARSFISPKQLREAIKVGEGQLGRGRAELSEMEAQDLTMNMELDLVPANGTDGKASESGVAAMEALLNLKSKKTSGRQGAGTQIKINAASNLGTYEIQRVDAIDPISVRGSVQSVLGIDKQYKTLQQVDLSAFS